MKKTAIILGASGLTGGYLLQKLIKDDRYGTIKLFSRSKIENQPSKVKQFIGDLLELDQFKNDFTGNELYCCIGTTKAKTPDKTLYRKIDYGIPVAASKLAKANGINTYLVISAMGANKNSSSFYTKTKGDMENEVLNHKINTTYILRPALISGDRDERRILESLGLTVLKIIQPLFFGALEKYKIVKAETIANAMIQLANTSKRFEAVVTSDQIQKLGNNN